MSKTESMKLPSSMRGGIAGMLITLLVIAAVGGATYFAVTSMLGGDDDGSAKQQAASQGLTQADAERIGREEGAKVAREIAYSTALDVAQASGGAALYGDSYASAETTDYGSYGDDSAYDDGADAIASSDSHDSYDSDSYDSDSYDTSSYDDYGSTGSSSASDSSSDTSSDSYASDDYAAADDYSSEDYGSSTSSAYDDSADDFSTDNYESEDFGLEDDTASDDFASDSGSTQAASAPTRSDPDEPEPVVSGKAPPPATAVVPWWPPAQGQSSGALKVLYAGTFAGGDGKGVGVLFGSAVKAGQSYGDFVKIIDDKGQAVTADWSLANNPALLKTGQLPAGRYLVKLKPGLESAQGRTQTLNIEGPVFID